VLKWISSWESPCYHLTNTKIQLVRTNTKDRLKVPKQMKRSLRTLCLRWTVETKMRKAVWRKMMSRYLRREDTFYLIHQSGLIWCSFIFCGGSLILVPLNNEDEHMHLSLLIVYIFDWLYLGSVRFTKNNFQKTFFRFSNVYFAENKLINENNFPLLIKSRESVFHFSKI